MNLDGLEPLEPQDLVLVGATGDLGMRRLMPAMYDLFTENRFPPDGRVIGLSREPYTREEFQHVASQAVRDDARRPFDARVWSRFCDRLYYVAALGDDGGLEEVRRLSTMPQRLVYLAIPPPAFEGVSENLAANDLAEGTRLVVEKPFGFDARSARALNGVLRRHFEETQIFRIDHYLGKETVQNILVFRFANAIFERIWHREAIDQMQITVAESTGIGSRGPFYEQMGALRDIAQNHLIQVLTLLTMEPPAFYDPDAIHDEKIKVLHAAEPIAPEDVVRGQYTSGVVEGEEVAGYLEEPGVHPDSETETYVAMKVLINNWRWSGVPFYLRSGKRLPRRVTEVHVQFRRAPVAFFRFFRQMDIQSVNPNHLTIRIQPEEGITISFLAKEPGAALRPRPVRMHFSYPESFASAPLEAYERLLYDAMAGDRTLFIREDTMTRAWEVMQRVLDDPPPVQPYRAGTWGPVAADRLVAPFYWHLH